MGQCLSRPSTSETVLTAPKTTSHVPENSAWEQKDVVVPSSNTSSTESDPRLKVATENHDRDSINRQILEEPEIREVQGPPAERPSGPFDGATDARSEMNTDLAVEQDIEMLTTPAQEMDEKDPRAGCKGKIHNLLRCGVPRSPNMDELAKVVQMINLMSEPACPELDILCKVVCEVFDAPHACVTLFEDRKVWISNNAYGVPAKPGYRLATCPWTFLTNVPLPLMVEDLCKDARFAETVWISRGVRVYVSSPLVSISGHRLGTICFVDGKPRRVDASTGRFMNNIGELAVRELEKYLGVTNKLLNDGNFRNAVSVRPLTRSLESVDEACILLVDTGTPGFKVLYASDTFHQWTGVPRESVVKKTLAEVLDIAAAGSMLSGCSPASRSVTGTKNSMLGSSTSNNAKGTGPEFLIGTGSFETRHSKGSSAADLQPTSVHGNTRLSKLPATESSQGRDETAGAGKETVSELGTPQTASGSVPGTEVATGNGEIGKASSAGSGPDPSGRAHSSIPNNLALPDSGDVYPPGTDAKTAAFWASLSKDAQAGRRFILSGVKIKQNRQQTPTSSAQPSRPLPASDNAEALPVSCESKGPSMDAQRPVDASAVSTSAHASVDNNVMLSAGHHDPMRHGYTASIGHPIRAASTDTTSGNGTYDCLSPTLIDSTYNLDGNANSRYSHVFDCSKGSVGSCQSLPAFDMSFRPAAYDRLDADTYEIAIPSWLEMRGFPGKPSTQLMDNSPEAQDVRKQYAFQKVYAVRLHRARHHVQPTSSSVRRLEALMYSLNSSDGLASQSDAARRLPDGSDAGNARPSYLSVLGPMPTSNGSLRSVRTSFEHHQPAVSNNVGRAKGPSRFSESTGSQQITPGQNSQSAASDVVLAKTSNSGTGASGNSTDAHSDHHNVSSRHHDGQHGTPRASIDLPLPSYGRTVLVQASLEQSVVEVFSGLTVGHTLGRGGYGVVMQATWHDTTVAVKVQDHVFKSMEHRKTAELEISVGQQLAHPNVLRTLAFASALLLADPKKLGRAAANKDTSRGTATPDRRRSAGTVKASGSNLGEAGKALGDASTAASTALSSVNATGTSVAGMDANQEGEDEMLRISEAIEAAVHAVEDMSVDAVVSGHQQHCQHAQGFTCMNSAHLDVEDMFMAMLLTSKNSLNSMNSNYFAAGAQSALLSKMMQPRQATIEEESSTLDSSTVVSAQQTSGSMALNDSDRSAATTTASALVTTEQVQLSTEDGSKQAPSGVASTQQLDHAPPSTASHQQQTIAAAVSPASTAGAGVALPGSKDDVAGVSGEAKSGGVVATVVDSQLPAEMIFPQRIRLWTIMELCNGGTLQDAIDRGWYRCAISQGAGPDMLCVLRTSLDVARGLEHLHSHGIVHADLSGFNVLLSTSGEESNWHQTRFSLPHTSLVDGTSCVHGQGTAPCKFVAKICDFGKAHRLEKPEDIIRRGDYGTITHMAPEVLLHGEIGQATDMYSLGVLMWSMYTGARPWAGLTHALIMSAVVMQEKQLTFPVESVGAPLIPASAPQAVKDAAAAAGIGTGDDWLKDMARRCMSFKACDRPTITDIREGLEALHDKVVACLATA